MSLKKFRKKFLFIANTFNGTEHYVHLRVPYKGKYVWKLIGVYLRSEDPEARNNAATLVCAVEGSCYYGGQANGNAAVFRSCKDGQVETLYNQPAAEPISMEKIKYYLRQANADERLQRIIRESKLAK